MSEATVSPILATASVLVVFVAVALIAAVDVPGAYALRQAVRRHTQHASLAIAGVAVAASLYYSESVGFIPCEFCWYQRIAIYPLAALLLVGVVTRTQLATRYIVTMAGIGLLLAIYHYQLQLFPEQGTVCTGGVPCTLRYVEEFGFISIPFMAGAGFLSILLLQVAQWRANRLNDQWDDEADA